MVSLRSPPHNSALNGNTMSPYIAYYRVPANRQGASNLTRLFPQAFFGSGPSRVLDNRFEGGIDIACGNVLDIGIPTRIGEASARQFQLRNIRYAVFPFLRETDRFALHGSQYRRFVELQRIGYDFLIGVGPRPFPQDCMSRGFTATFTVSLSIFPTFQEG